VLTVSCADPLPPAITGGLMLQLAWLSDSPLSVSDTSRRYGHGRLDALAAYQ
jgi:hypothetical protein